METHPIRPSLAVLWAMLVALPSLSVGQEARDPQPDIATASASELDAQIEPIEDKAAAQALDRGIGESAVGDEKATLRVWNRTIAELRARLAGMDPEERAAQATKRITSLPDALLTKDVWTEPAQIRGTDLIMIGVEGSVLLAMAQEDLDPTSEQTLTELSAEVAGLIQEVLAARAEQRHWPNLVRAILLSLGATLIFLVLMWVIVRLRTRLARGLARLLARRDVHVSGFDLRPYLRNLVRGTVALISWFLIIPVAYVWLTFVLTRFPFTKPWGDDLGRFLVDLLTELLVGALSAIPGLFTVFLIFVITRFLTRLVSAFFVSVENEALRVNWLQPETAKATRRLVIVVMWIFALTVVYPYIPGSGTAAFKGVSVFVGLMVSLGATGMVNQIVSGMVIVYTRAFRPGEYVRIGETEGFVQEIGVLSTKISTLRREHITIPNAVLINTSVNNYSRDAAEQGAVISTSVTIGYDVPWRQVHALLELAASRCSGVRAQPEPRVLQKGLSDFYVEYTLLVNIDDPAQRYVISSELHGQIQDAFNEHGVQILSPHYLDKAEDPVVVPKDGWIKPPAEQEPG